MTFGKNNNSETQLVDYKSVFSSGFPERNMDLNTSLASYTNNVANDIFVPNVNNSISNLSTLNYSLENATSVSPLCELNDYCEPVEDYIDRLYSLIYPTQDEWILIAAYIVTFIIGVVGNSLVCFAILRNRNMRTTTNMFIMNLSVADLAVIIICLPLALVLDVTNTWFFGTAVCWIYTFFSTVSINVSVLTLCAISIERWHAICHPLRFHSTTGRARTIIIIIWFVSICAALPITVTSSATMYKPYTIYFTSCYPSMWSKDALVIFQLCFIVGVYFLPLGLMAFAYIQIAMVLWRNQAPRQNISQRIRRPMLSVDSSSTEQETPCESRKKAARMLIAVVIVFAICYLPNHALNIGEFTGSLDKWMSGQTKTMLALFAHWFVFFNSCINPVIYNFMSGKFRQEFKASMLLCCICCRRQQYVWHDSFRVTFNTANYRTISVRTGLVSNRRIERTQSGKPVIAQQV